jgi:hypothetical protein
VTESESSPARAEKSVVARKWSHRSKGRNLAGAAALMDIHRAWVRRALGAVNVLTLTTGIVLAVTTRPPAAAVSPANPTAPVAGLTQVPGLPPSATCPVVYTDITKPFNAGSRGTPMTSCPFVEQVRRAYAIQNPSGIGTQPIRAVSPTTHKLYDMLCTAVDGYATCVGGQGAIVYLYHG